MMSKAKGKKMKLLKITDKILNYQFIPVPNKLLHSKEYFKISANAKLIYILFIERLGLSKHNKFCNDKEEIYIVYCQKKLCEILNKTDKTIKKAIDELIENKLIYKEKSGIGKVDKYYIYDIFQNGKQGKITNDNRKFF